MKLLVAIIQDEYTDKVLSMARELGVRMTRLTSTGGFFKKGNTTFLVGLEDEIRNEFYDNVKNICKELDCDPEAKTVCGANMFVIGVDEFRKV